MIDRLIFLYIRLLPRKRKRVTRPSFVHYHWSTSNTLPALTSIDGASFFGVFRLMFQTFHFLDSSRCAMQLIL